MTERYLLQNYITIVAIQLTSYTCMSIRMRKVLKWKSFVDLQMSIQFRNYLASYVPDISFVAKGYTTKLFLRIFLNSVIYETFYIAIYTVQLCGYTAGEQLSWGGGQASVPYEYNAIKIIQKRIREYNHQLQGTFLSGKYT